MNFEELKKLVQGVNPEEQARSFLAKQGYNPLGQAIKMGIPITQVPEIAKEYIYNPDTKRIFPQSPVYPENRPQMVGNEITNIESAFPIALGLTGPSALRGTKPPTIAESQAENLKPAASMEGVKMQPIENFPRTTDVTKVSGGVLPKGGEINPLIQEAKKYKSAEEFIQSQQAKNVTFTSAKQKPDYMGGHEAPMAEDINAPIWDLTGTHTGKKLYPKDIYSGDASRMYSSGMDYDNQAISILQSVKDRPNAKVTIYRAIPKDIKENKINAGDWVTLVRDYAKDHGESNLGGNYKIIKKEVSARDIFTDANSIQEFGYDPQPVLRGKDVPFDLLKKHIGSEKPTIYSGYIKRLTDIWNKAQREIGKGVSNK